jgi:hypothetical protein
MKTDRIIDRDSEAAHFRSLERIAARLADIDPEDPTEGAERSRARLLALRQYHRAHLGILDDDEERSEATEWRVRSTDRRLERARIAAGLPAEGPVDWAAVRRSLGRLPADERAMILGD